MVDLVLAGCGQSTDTTSTSRAPAALGTLEDGAIEADAAHYATFAKINLAPYTTRQHAENPLVNVYANAIAESSYRAVDPSGTPPAGFAFPPGSMLVKEMPAPAGGGSVLTVMYKKSPGYDPPRHDWWYARLRSDGVPTDPAYAGQVDFCVSCHGGTEKWDYAWGLPAASKAR